MLNLVFASVLASLSVGQPVDLGPPTLLIIPPADGGARLQPASLSDASATGEAVQSFGAEAPQARSGEEGAPLELSDLQPPCRQYADEPSSQPDTSFARCWNTKKTAWDFDKPSAVGLTLPQMNTPLGQDAPSGGKPRDVPTP